MGPRGRKSSIADITAALKADFSFGSAWCGAVAYQMTGGALPDVVVPSWQHHVTETEVAANAARFTTEGFYWGVLGGYDPPRIVDGTSLSRTDGFARALADVATIPPLFRCRILELICDNIQFVDGVVVGGTRMTNNEVVQYAWNTDGMEAFEARLLSAFAATGGGVIDGVHNTAAQCHARIIEGAQSNELYYVEAWLALGVAGGGTVRGEAFSRAECFDKMLEEDPSLGWQLLALTPNAVTTAGSFTPLECAEKSVADDVGMTSATAWAMLADHNGGTVQSPKFAATMMMLADTTLGSRVATDGQSVCMVAELCRAVARMEALGPKDAAAVTCVYDVLPRTRAEYDDAIKHLSACVHSNVVDIKRQTGIDGDSHRVRDAFLQADMWALLASLGGVELAGKRYAPQDCLDKCLDYLPTYRELWAPLLVTGGIVGGIVPRTARQCAYRHEQLNRLASEVEQM
jgi:hypothetical protein